MSIVPAEEFKRSSELFERARKSWEPILLTDDGKPDVVIMSAPLFKSYEEERNKFFEAFVLERLRKGLADVRAGRTVDAFEAIDQIREELGLDAVDSGYLSEDDEE